MKKSVLSLSLLSFVILAVFAILFCTDPVKPDFASMRALYAVVHTNRTHTDTLKNNHVFYINDTLFAAIRVDKPDLVQNLRILARDSASDTKFKVRVKAKNWILAQPSM